MKSKKNYLTWFTVNIIGVRVNLNPFVIIIAIVNKF